MKVMNIAHAASAYDERQRAAQGQDKRAVRSRTVDDLADEEGRQDGVEADHEHDRLRVRVGERRVHDLLALRPAAEAQRRESAAQRKGLRAAATTWAGSPVHGRCHVAVVACGKDRRLGSHAPSRPPPHNRLSELVPTARVVRDPGASGAVSLRVCPSGYGACAPMTARCRLALRCRSRSFRGPSAPVWSPLQ